MALLSVPVCDRPGFFQALNEHLAQAAPADYSVGVVLLDIKDFTSINRVFDFKYGDLVLYHLTERLLQLSRQSHCLFRLGSDEFALIVPALENNSELMLEANHLLAELREPLRWGDEEINIDINMGCAAMAAADTTAQALLGRAEQLLQQAKLENRTLCYGSDVDVPVDQDAWQLEQELLRALHNNELEMMYQPKVDLLSGRPVHAEALMRWRHPSRGYISPNILVPMITRLNREFELTKWALHTALRQVASWASLASDQGVAVNIPANLVHHPDFRQLVEDALKLWQVRPEQLTLEITENAILEDQPASFKNLSALKAQGLHISIDDFGTGYSSLQYFKTIPATELKIDQSFVFNMANNEDDKNIAQLIIELAHRFGLKVVAEGVEEQQVLDELKALGCDYAQGYFISHPLSGDDYRQWLSQHPWPTDNPSHPE